jgi:2-dehydro-3-deoxyphosphogluconate aldolase/(4S)-4-hydroxy-2-oxoglutarate aldolase
MHQVLEELEKTGIVPVITIDDAEKAVPLARALLAGGIPCAELTFRTPQGEEALRRIAGEVPEILPGAGTVLNTGQVDRAIAAGAKFIVSPGLNPRVVGHCVERGIPVIPGCSNPSDIEQALEAGLGAVKFFPAEQAGGLDYIKALSAPYPGLKFIPTGGINAGNIAAYIAFDKVLACGGSWMAGADLVRAGDFARITARCREAVSSLLGFSLAQVGVRAEDGADARRFARLFEALFGVAPPPGPGTRGDIVIETNTLRRAQVFLERAGFAFRPEASDTGVSDDTDAGVYLRDEIGGFAVHLVQRK